MHFDQIVREWVDLESPEEKQEAFDYLKLWKKFYLRQLPSYRFVKEVYRHNGLLSIGLELYLERIDDDKSDA